MSQKKNEFELRTIKKLTLAENENAGGPARPPGAFTSNIQELTARTYDRVFGPMFRILLITSYGADISSMKTISIPGDFVNEMSAFNSMINLQIGVYGKDISPFRWK